MSLLVWAHIPLIVSASREQTAVGTAAGSFGFGGPILSLQPYTKDIQPMLNEDPVANRPSELDDGTLFKANVVKYEVFGLSQSKVRQYDSFAFTDARLINEVDAFE